MRSSNQHAVWMRVVGGALCGAVLAACAGTSTPAPAQTVRFAYDLWPGYYPALIAIEKGFFAEEHLTVQASKPENTDAVLSGLLGGVYDAAAVSLGDVVSLAALNGDVRVIIVTDESAGGDAIVAQDSIQTWADLRGQRIGVNKGSFAELYVQTMLQKNGLNPTEVTFVDMDAADLPEKLKNGDVIAGHTWEPYVSQAKNAGARVLSTSADTPGLIPDVVAVLGSTLRARPEAVRAFVNGWFKGVDFWKTDFESGAAAAAAQLHIQSSEISLDGIKLLTRDDNRALFTPGPSTASLYHTAGLYIEFFVASGNLTTRPDVNQLLDATLVK